MELIFHLKSKVPLKYFSVVLSRSKEFFMFLEVKTRRIKSPESGTVNLSVLAHSLSISMPALAQMSMTRNFSFAFPSKTQKRAEKAPIR